MNTDERILIVDDDPDILTAGRLLLKRHYGEVVTCPAPDQIPALLKENSFRAILLDMNFSPGASDGSQGFEWLGRIMAIDPEAVVVMITAHGSVDLAVQAMKRGATDFIAKPWDNDRVIATLSAATELKRGRRPALNSSSTSAPANSAPGSTRLLGTSAAMNEVHSLIRRAAPTDANILILGENGTGKELVARALHEQSRRADRAFVSIDLGAVPESLFESELFGHRKGAFTGATADREGRVTAASGGTLFLDEIGNISPHLQARLLTVLEQRRLTPLGSTESIHVDVRVIAATNLPPDALRDDATFRQDLLFRLNTVEIQLPPLRGRTEDIPEIAEYYARLYAEHYQRPYRPLASAALDAARAHPWPGNVRALRHAIERAVILAEGESIEPADLQLDTPLNASRSSNALESSLPEQRAAGSESGEDLHLERAEKRMVAAALERHGYNISKAARDLGLTRAALYRRMEKHGL